MKKILNFLVLASLLSLSFSAPTVHACSCVIPGTTTEEMEKADAVFSGNVVGISESLNYGYDVYIDVEQSWKGVDEVQVKVHTGTGGGDCGYSFNTGTEYLVFASASEDRYEVSSCGLTQTLSGAAEILAELGVGDAVEAEEVAPWVTEEMLQTVAVLSLVLLAGLAWGTRRKKK